MLEPHHPWPDLVTHQPWSPITAGRASLATAWRRWFKHQWLELWTRGVMLIASCDRALYDDVRSRRASMLSPRSLPSTFPTTTSRVRDRRANSAASHVALLTSRVRPSVGAALPDAIAGLVKLADLNLQANALTALPEALGGLGALTTVRDRRPTARRCLRTLAARVLVQLCLRRLRCIGGGQSGLDALSCDGTTFDV
jgi:hypothetical protein